MGAAPTIIACTDACERCRRRCRICPSMSPAWKRGDLCPAGCTLPSCYRLRANGVSHRYLLLGLLERLLPIILGILSGGGGRGGGLQGIQNQSVYFPRTQSLMDAWLLLVTVFFVSCTCQRFLILFCTFLRCAGLPRSWSYPREACVVPWYVESR